MLKRPRAASLLALLALLSGCNEKAADGQLQSKPLTLPVTKVEVVDIPLTSTVPGSIVSDGRVEVSSRVVGFIEQLDVREGQWVSRGDLLLRIDRSEIDEAIRQARAGVDAGRKDLDDAEQDVQKFNKLAQSGSVASETLRKAKVRFDIARAALDRTRSTLAAAEAQKGYASIESPVDGVIVSVARRKGEMATAGSRILTVESREILLFKAFVSEGNLAAIDPTRPVTVRIDTLKNRRFEGRIRGIVPSGDDVTRRYEINIILPNDAMLVPGMFGRAEIPLGTQKAPVVPRNAMVRRGGLEGVFVIEDKAAQFRWLRTGREWDGSVEVTSGLSGGETILARADDTVRDGAPVVAAEGTR